MTRTYAALITHILPCAVSAPEEVNIARIPHREHPFLELLEVFTRPSFVVAHQFGRLRKLIAIESGSQCPVAVSAHQLTGVCPLHQDSHGCGSVRLGTVNLPTQGILISHGGTACGVDVVLARTAATDNRLYGIGGDARLGVFCILQYVVCLGDGSVALCQLTLDAVEVGLGMKTAWMAETFLGVIDIGDAANIEHHAFGSLEHGDGSLEFFLAVVVNYLTAFTLGNALGDDKRILQLHHSSYGIVGSGSEQLFCLTDGFQQRGIVATTAVCHLIFQFFGLLCQCANLLCRHAAAIISEVGNKSLCEILV